MMQTLAIVASASDIWYTVSKHIMLTCYKLRVLCTQQARLLREADAVAQLEAEAAALAHKREADLKLMQEVSTTMHY